MLHIHYCLCTTYAHSTISFQHHRINKFLCDGHVEANPYFGAFNVEATGTSADTNAYLF